MLPGLLPKKLTFTCVPPMESGPALLMRTAKVAVSPTWASTAWWENAPPLIATAAIRPPAICPLVAGEGPSSDGSLAGLAPLCPVVVPSEDRWLEAVPPSVASTLPVSERKSIAHTAASNTRTSAATTPAVTCCDHARSKCDKNPPAPLLFTTDGLYGVRTEPWRRIGYKCSFYVGLRPG